MKSKRDIMFEIRYFIKRVFGHKFGCCNSITRNCKRCLAKKYGCCGDCEKCNMTMVNRPCD